VRGDLKPSNRGKGRKVSAIGHEKGKGTKTTKRLLEEAGKGSGAQGRGV